MIGDLYCCDFSSATQRNELFIPLCGYNAKDRTNIKHHNGCS